MIDLIRFNQYWGFDYKVYNGYINAYKYVILSLDNSLVYYNKKTNHIDKIHNKEIIYNN